MTNVVRPDSDFSFKNAIMRRLSELELRVFRLQGETGLGIGGVGSVVVFSTATNPWVIAWESDTPPVAVVVDSAGQRLEADQKYDEINKILTITFSGPMSGKVYLS